MIVYFSVVAQQINGNMCADTDDVNISITYLKLIVLEAFINSDNCIMLTY